MERPILFSAPMVRALLDGTKTQTRRVVKAQPPAYTFKVSTWHHPDPRPHFYAWQKLPHETAMMADGWCYPCPYGAPGDRLWVRETHMDLGACYLYRADADAERERTLVAPGQWWRPAIHMPRAASRITLEVTAVRVERLQDISEADAVAEGIERSGECNWRDYLDHPYNNFTSARRSYRSLWESINGPGAWDAKPWVWVVEFKRSDSPARAHSPEAGL